MWRRGRERGERGEREREEREGEGRKREDKMIGQSQNGILSLPRLRPVSLSRTILA